MFESHGPTHTPSDTGSASATVRPPGEGTAAVRRDHVGSPQPGTTSPAEGSGPPFGPPTTDPPTPPPPPPAAPPLTSREKSSGGGGAGRWKPAPIIAASILSAVVAAGVTATVVDDDPSPVTTGATTAQTSDDAAGDTSNAGSEPTPVVSGEERAAIAAERVAPAVVQIETGTGVGSGVIYTEDGHILTVAHVVQDSRDVAVKLADGSTVEGEVVGADATTDVAVIKIDGDDVPAVADLALGRELVVGQLAVAVGCPYGFDQTVTSGIVSAVDRVVNNITMVQTDAAINRGNSGGPLVNADGAVIGLSDVIFSETGGSQGVGFAIQIDLVNLVADQLVAGEDVRLAFLGVSTISPADGTRGAQIAEVVDGSAADEAGIEVGDIITSIDGEDIGDGAELRAQVIGRDPGTGVTLGVNRDGETIEVEATLGATG